MKSLSTANSASPTPGSVTPSLSRKKLETQKSTPMNQLLHSRLGSPGITPSQLDGMNDDPATLLARINLIEKDLERRQESYVARERAYKTRIDELEDELSEFRQNKTGWMKTDEKMSKLKHMQGQIMGNIELVQDRTARILQEQERDLLRAFRARLFDVQTELEKEKSKKDDGAGAWIEKCRQLEAELEWAKEVSDRLERVNQTLLQENGRLKSQFASQEEDRNFLIKQLVAVKKDNGRLRAEYSALESENESLKNMQKNQETQANNAGPRLKDLLSSNKNESEEKYKEINVRLKRLLAEERKSLQQLRQNYAQELKSRTELELLLRQSVDDVRKEIAKKKLEAAQFSQTSDLPRLYSRQPGLIPVEDFTQEDRERALELLLSQERVVTLLYAKTFPVSNANAPVNPSLTGNYPAAPKKNINVLAVDSSAALLEDDAILAMESRPQTTSATQAPSSLEKLPSVAGQSMSITPGRPQTSSSSKA